MAAARCIWPLVLGLSACSLSVGFEDSRYACAPPAGECPTGFVCGQDGFCAPAGSDEPDADVPFADAGADAPPLADGAPSDALPDGNGLPITVSFGERADSDVTGVTFDTYLTSVNQSENKGGNSDMVCTTNPDRTALLRFDLSSIPPGALVLGATLEVWTGPDSSVSAARVIPMLEAWDEGNQVDASGFANWVFRKPGFAWSGEGATPPSRAAQYVVEFLPNDAETPYGMLLPNLLVQNWIDLPAANFGIAIVPVSDNSDFDLKSSESTIAERRPELTITYVP